MCVKLLTIRGLRFTIVIFLLFVMIKFSSMNSMLVVLRYMVICANACSGNQRTVHFFLTGSVLGFCVVLQSPDLDLVTGSV